MPVFCTEFTVFLQHASPDELLSYFHDGEAPDCTARAAMAWLGQHRPSVRDDLLCRLHGVTVLEGATAEAARARFVVQLKLVDKFRDAHPAGADASLPDDIAQLPCGTTTLLSNPIARKPG